MREMVYLLYHIRNSGELILVGVYQSELDAQAAIERSKKQPGFSQFPNDFEVHSYDLGVDLWPDGFSVDEETFSDEPLPEQPARKIN